MSVGLFPPIADEPARRHAPATDRNREPILEVLTRALPPSGLVLEIASGSGQHAAFFGSRLPNVTWQPTDADPELIASIDAWVVQAGAKNVRRAIQLDVITPWPVSTVSAVICINMIHIAPWAATEALLRGAAEHLPEGGPLVLYGPFREDGEHTSESNARFDADLRSRDPSWGVRDLDEVARVAAGLGLDHAETVRMPANNLTVVFRRQGARFSLDTAGAR